MGCDIHAIVQRKVNGAWETVKPPPEMLDKYGCPPWAWRSYTTFGILAGVRDHDVTPIAEPRGFPPGAMITTDDNPGWGGSTSANLGDDWLGDHSFSWVTVREIADYDFTAKHPGYGHTLAEMSGLVEALPWLLSLGDPDDVRLVFGFDS